MKDEKKEKEELIAMVPELPEGFIEWCENQMANAPVFYKRTGNYTECRCGMCGEQYRLHTPKEPEFGTIYSEIPKKNEITECVKCGKQTYYEWKKVTKVMNEERWFYLYQLLKDGSVIVRIFDCWRRKQQGLAQETETEEVERIFLIKGQVKKMVSMYYYFTGEAKWVMEQGKGYPRIENTTGEVYPGWEKVLEESNLKYCRVEEIATMAGIGTVETLSRINILMAYANNPAIEMYEKAGLKKLVRALVWREGIIGCLNRRKTTLEGQLRLKDKEKIKKFMKREGDPILLEMLQYEEKHGYRWTEEQEKWVEYYWGTLNYQKSLDVFMKYMSIQKLMNRIKKYKETRREYYSLTEIIGEYRDYLQMREELGYNMENEVFLYPRNLHEKHQEMTKEKNARNNELTIKKKNKEFSRIAERYTELCEKYQARTGGYIIRPARDAGEIIMEGRTLHHCVGRDLYLKSHNDGKSTILFLRKEKSPDEPYITIEIRGTEIKQWYGVNDTKPDKEIIERLLKDYVKQLKRHIGKENKETIKKAV